MILRQKTEYIVLHCSYTKRSQRYGFEECRRDHLNRGWSNIGYQFYIEQDGTVKLGRALLEKGAHSPRYNSTGIGICYEGGKGENGFPEDTRTEKQKEAMTLLIKALLTIKQKNWNIIKIVGHRAPALDKCPCFDVESEYGNLI